MQLDITFDTEAEEIAIVVDDHNVIKLGFDSGDVIPINRAARVMSDEDSDLYETLAEIANVLFVME
jgi:hypothetical protein